jgi:hypothetical protein
MFFNNSAMMPRYLDPKTDVVFKKIFGNHPELLKSFLNAVLPLPEDCIIESLTYLPSESTPEIAGLKYSIVDVRCFDNHGRHFIVEMQLQWTVDFIKRMLYNTAATYTRQLLRLPSKLADADEVQGASGAQTRSVQEVLEDASTGATQQFVATVEFSKKSIKGEEYKKLSPVYGLALLNERFDKGQEWFHHYRMTNVDDQSKNLEDIQLVLIELPKLKPASRAERRLAVLWLRFLKEMGEQTVDVDPSFLEVAPIKEAVSLLELASYNQAELLAYDKIWDAISSEKTLLSGKYEEGKAEGKAEIIATILRSGLSVEQVAKIVGLPQEQVEKIRDRFL